MTDLKNTAKLLEHRGILGEVYHGSGCYIIYFSSEDMERDNFERLTGISIPYEESVICLLEITPQVVTEDA